MVYLDHAATTPMLPEAIDALTAALAVVGNPSSIHSAGQQAKRLLEESRERVAATLGADGIEVVFTGNGTEAVNLAIKGLWWQRRTAAASAAEPAAGSSTARRRILMPAGEHHATIDTAEWLVAHEGAEVVELPLDEVGRLRLDVLADELERGAASIALVTMLWANNETGVLFPVDRIAALCKSKRVPFHCDGTQAVGKIPVNVHALGLDAMSCASHKFHGPKGVGSLFVRRGLRIRPLVIGGPQEHSHRGGTENVPGIVGMGVAAQLAQAALPEMTRVAAMRDRLESAILTTIDQTKVNGRTDTRLPNTTNIGFSRLEAEAILLLLSEQNICASAGAACSSGSLEPSHVLQAMKIDPKTAHGAIRFSLSRYTTQQDIDRALEVLPKVIHRLRAVLPVG